MSKDEMKKYRYRGYDYLDKCPWCEGELENGVIQGIRGLRWITNKGYELTKITIFGGKYFGSQVAQKCNNCKKTLLLGKKRRFINFIEEESPSERAKYNSKNDD
jgi:hypothetical protein